MTDTNDVPNLEISAEDMKLIAKLESIFMPVARAQRDKFYDVDPTTSVSSDSARFVHYTSAEAALNIITSKRLMDAQCNEHV